MTTCVLDFETRSLANLKKCGAPRYAQDPSTEVLTLCWMVGDAQIESWHPGEPIEATSLWQAIRAGATLIAHKASFEKSIWRHIMVPSYGWPPVLNSQWHDTLAVCAMKAIPQGLDQATRVLRLKDLKDKEGSRFTVNLSKSDRRTGNFVSLTPEIMERVDRYCADDVYAQWGLHNRIGWLTEGERNVWLMDQRINERGFKIDLPLVRAMQSIVDKASKPLSDEFEDITSGLKFTQIAKFGNWLREQGVNLPNLTAETVAEALGHSPDLDDDDLETAPSALPENARRALEIRQLVGSAAVKKLAAAEACVMDDSRVRDSLQYHGATPGLWAGRLLQPHNFPRGTIKGDPETKVAVLMSGDPDYVEAFYGPAVETVVSSLRHIIIPARGRELVAGDFSGIQARIALALAGATEKVALMASSPKPGAVYCDAAQAIYGYEIGKDTHPVEYQDGKATVLGLGFGMGKDKFSLKYGKGRPIEFSKRVVDTYRQDWAPEIPKMWRGLERASVKTVWDRRAHEAYGCRYQLEDLWMTCRLPSGRKLWYFNPQPIREAMPWDEDDIREGFQYQAMKMGQWKTIKAFGGHLVENIASGLARDLLVKAIFACEENHLPVVLTVHDEVISEPLEKYADPNCLREIMLDRPAWACETGVPIDAECWSGGRYRK